MKTRSNKCPSCYLNFAGNAEEALSFYRTVFGGELSSAIKFKDFPIVVSYSPPRE